MTFPPIMRFDRFDGTLLPLARKIIYLVLSKFKNNLLQAYHLFNLSSSMFADDIRLSICVCDNETVVSSANKEKFRIEEHLTISFM